MEGGGRGVEVGAGWGEGRAEGVEVGAEVFVLFVEEHVFLKCEGLVVMQAHAEL